MVVHNQHAALLLTKFIYFVFLTNTKGILDVKHVKSTYNDKKYIYIFDERKVQQQNFEE